MHVRANLEKREMRGFVKRPGLTLVTGAVAALILLHFAYGLAHRLYNASSPGDLTFGSDFESGDIAVWRGKGAIQVCCGDSVVIVPAPVRSGRYSARFTLRRSDADVKGSKRAELRT